MTSWSDATLQSLNTWIGWFGVVSTLVGVLVTAFSIMVANEVARRDERKDEVREQLLVDTQKEAREAKALSVKTDNKLQPRTITPEQEAAFTDALGDSPRGRVHITSAGSADDFPGFTDTVRQLLIKTGFQIGWIGAAMLRIGAPPAGLAIGAADVTNPPPHAIPLTNAFRAAGLDVRGVNDGTAPGEVTVHIGGKP